MFTVTFYSYKGGVGRTMSLANVAYRLSAMGKRVFVVDFDLEAPGLDIVLMPHNHDRVGLVEYVSHYIEKGEVRDLDSYVSALPTDEGAGALYLLAAGKKDTHYQSLLANLDWKRLYSEKSGFLFFENLKGAISSKYNPDYLLIDSRTGLTDSSGICTVQLPDLVVLLFALNEQNVRGVSRIYRSIKQNKVNREISTLLVASPVPESAALSEIKKTRMQHAQEVLGQEISGVLPFDSSIAFQETILKYPSALSDAYDRLANDLIAKNKFDLFSLLKQAHEEQRDGNSEQARAIFQTALETYPEDFEAHRQFGVFLRSLNEFDNALLEFEKALSIKHNPRVFGEIALTGLLRGDLGLANEWFQRYVETAKTPHPIATLSNIFGRHEQTDLAIQGLTRALALLEPEEQDDARFILGILGMLHLRTRDFDSAIPWLERSIEVNPNSTPTTYNLGYAYELAGRVGDARRLYSKAIELYENASLEKIPPAIRANQAQAIAHAFSYIGKTSNAIQCLQAAIRIAQSVSASKIMSSSQYREIPASEFREETAAVLAQMEASNPK